MKSILSAAFVATLAFLPAAEAATINSVSYSNGGVGDPACGEAEAFSNQSNQDLGAVFNRSAAGCNVQMRAAVVGGGIGLQASANSSLGGNLASQAKVSGSQRVTGLFLTPLFDPLTYEGPNRISIAANLSIDGTLESEIDSASQFVRSATASVTANATIRGALDPFPGSSVSDRRTFTDSVGAINDLGDASESATLIGQLRPGIQHDWRAPFSIEMSFSGNAGAFSGGDSAASAGLDALNTFSFSKSGPAFDIPSIFTINAPELNIFNNRWIDPRSPVDPGPSAVPLPAGLPLFLAGLGALGILRRKR